MENAGEDKRITLETAVTNIGKEYAGREVVQVYYTAPEGELSKPYQELAAFAKTRLLKPGETQRLTVEFMRSDMASYSTKDAAWVLEPGEYMIRFGADSSSTSTAGTVTVEEKTVTRQLTNCRTESLSGQKTGSLQRPVLEDKYR